MLFGTLTGDGRGKSQRFLVHCGVLHIGDCISPLHNLYKLSCWHTPVVMTQLKAVGREKRRDVTYIPCVNIHVTRVPP
jgi:hypothetical protein